MEPRLTPERCAEVGVAHAETLDDLLRASDVVSVHVTLNDKSRGLLGARELALMKPDAYLVNTSRGPIVDEQALIAALREKRIAGAGLDVFDRDRCRTIIRCGGSTMSLRRRISGM